MLINHKSPITPDHPSLLLFYFRSKDIFFHPYPVAAAVQSHADQSAA